MNWAKLALLAGGGVALYQAFKKGAEVMGAKPTFPYLSIGSGFYLETRAAQKFLQMQEAAKAVGLNLSISTAWRDPAHQVKLYRAWLAYQAGTGPWAPMAARPGTSNHEKGIAVDLNGLDPAKSNYNSKMAAWLKINGPSFNWYNSVASEPWHWAFGVIREGANPLLAV